MNENRYYKKKKKKKKKYKFPGGLGWGDPGNYGAVGSGTGFDGGGDGGGMGESLIREYIRQVLMESHSKSKCMEKGCEKPPEVECMWANGYGRAWFCKPHFKTWSTKGDGKGDIVKQRDIENGKVGEKYGEEL